jgi:Tfp pilus assembly protein PilV
MITKLRRLMRPIIIKGGSKEGFSILENIISMAIFSVGILSISMLFTQTMTFTHNSEKMTVATNLAKGKLEELRNTPYTNIVSGTDSENIDNVQYDLEWTVTNDTPLNGVKKIVIEVSWVDLRKGHTIELSTLYSRF